MREVKIAQEIQAHVLPAENLAWHGLVCSGWTRSPSEIGGELFDYFTLQKGSLALAQAGIPGRGISSALIIAMTKMTLRVLLEQDLSTPSGYLERMEAQFCEVKGFSRISFFLALLEAGSREISYTVAGSSRVFIMTPDGSVQTAPFGSPPLGVPRPGPLQTRTIAFPQGSRMMVCSEGLFAMDEDVGFVSGAGTNMDTIAGALRQTDAPVGPHLFSLLDRISRSPRPDRPQTVLILDGMPAGTAQTPVNPPRTPADAVEHMRKA